MNQKRMSHEPFAHLGFKILVTIWGMCTIGYMNRSLELKIQKINLLQNQKLQLKQNKLE
jgi:hypothetical protein